MSRRRDRENRSSYESRYDDGYTERYDGLYDDRYDDRYDDYDARNDVRKIDRLQNRNDGRDSEPTIRKKLHRDNSPSAYSDDSYYTRRRSSPISSRETRTRKPTRDGQKKKTSRSSGSGFIGVVTTAIAGVFQNRVPNREKEERQLRQREFGRRKQERRMAEQQELERKAKQRAWEDQRDAEIVNDSQTLTYLPDKQRTSSEADSDVLRFYEDLLGHTPRAEIARGGSTSQYAAKDEPFSLADPYVSTLTAEDTDLVIDPAANASSNIVTTEASLEKPLEYRFKADIFTRRLKVFLKRRLQSSSTGIMLLRYFRPGLRTGLTRIEWTCSCGNLLYGDYSAEPPTSARILEAELQVCAARPAHNDASSSNSPHISSRGQVSSPSGSARTRSVDITEVHKGKMPLEESLPGDVRHPDTSSPNTCSFLELCVKTGPHVTVLEEMPIRNRDGHSIVDNDIRLFRKFGLPGYHCIS